MINATDSAIALAEENSIDLSLVEGNGQDGRVLKSDVQKFIDELALTDEPADEPKPSTASSDGPDDDGSDEPADEAQAQAPPVTDDPDDGKPDGETAVEDEPDEPADEDQAQAPPVVDEPDSDEPDPDDETAVEDEEPAPAIPTDTVVPVQLRGAREAMLAGHAIRRDQVRAVTYGHYLAAKQANPGIFAVRLPGSSEFTVE